MKVWVWGFSKDGLSSGFSAFWEGMEKPKECSRSNSSGGIVSTFPLPQPGFPWRSQAECILGLCPWASDSDGEGGVFVFPASSKSCWFAS